MRVNSGNSVVESQRAKRVCLIDMLYVCSSVENPRVESPSIGRVENNKFHPRQVPQTYNISTIYCRNFTYNIRQ